MRFGLVASATCRQHRTKCDAGGKIFEVHSAVSISGGKMKLFSSPTLRIRVIPYFLSFTCFIKERNEFMRQKQQECQHFSAKKRLILLPRPPPKNYIISSAFSYRFKSTSTFSHTRILQSSAFILHYFGELHDFQDSSQILGDI